MSDTVLVAEDRGVAACWYTAAYRARRRAGSRVETSGGGAGYYRHAADDGYYGILFKAAVGVGAVDGAASDRSE